MRIPNLAATIERRLLISYAVEPELLQPILPEGLRPQLVKGVAVAGICLIRLGNVRPSLVKTELGWGGENAAHRIAVEYEDDNGVTKTGVYIPERHSNSILPILAGGRIFPGKHTRAEFTVNETPTTFDVTMEASDDRVSVQAERTDEWTSNLFPSLQAASSFYQDSPVGWSPVMKHPDEVEGLRLSTDAWKVSAARKLKLKSSYFDKFPKESVQFDHILVMQNIPVLWSKP